MTITNTNPNTNTNTEKQEGHYNVEKADIINYLNLFTSSIVLKILAKILPKCSASSKLKSFIVEVVNYLTR